MYDLLYALGYTLPFIFVAFLVLFIKNKPIPLWTCSLIAACAICIYVLVLKDRAVYAGILAAIEAFIILYTVPVLCSKERPKPILPKRSQTKNKEGK